MSAPPNRFREHRERVGMTQAEVAAKIGISIPTVARHEGGSRLPSPALAEQYAELYGVMSAELFVDVPGSPKWVSSPCSNRMLEIRSATVLTYHEAARLVGMNAEDHLRFESGEVMPSRRLCKRYAEVYKVTTAELFVRLPAYTTSEG